jgi:hypothetical protein
VPIWVPVARPPVPLPAYSLSTALEVHRAMTSFVQSPLKSPVEFDSDDGGTASEPNA